MRTSLIHHVLKSAKGTRDPEQALAEAKSLVSALDVDLVRSDIVTLAKADAGHLFGKGKIEELRLMIEADEIDLVVVNGTVTPVQQRNLERAWKVKVLDRTALILEIFGERARTKEGVLQVDLAHLSYQKTRLVRAWTHLERQRGGGGFMGGPGETQIEADRRALDDSIIRLKRQLAKVVKTRTLHREARKKVPYPIVALVGYTNAGKSTIFNRLTGADVLAKDMVFATLDPTMRSLQLPSGRDVILSDTVGFISDLPTQLVAAFRATLEEVLDADLVVHVRDIAHPEAELQAENVITILTEIGMEVEGDSAPLEIWNKLDLCDEEARQSLTTAAARDDMVIPASAVTGEGLDQLLERVEVLLQGSIRQTTLRLPHSEGRARAWLYANNLVTDERTDGDETLIDVSWTPADEGKFAADFDHLLTASP